MARSLIMKLYLAPMEGVVDHQLRKIYAAIGGIDLCVTEFIRVTHHVLPDHVFLKYCPELLEEHRHFSLNGQQHRAIPIRVQLLGSDPELLAKSAVQATQLGAIGIDLNFGCPAKTVNRNKGGACLLDDTHLLAEIVSTVRQHVPSDIPVTAKIRLGFNDRNSYLDNAIAIANAGASELVVHARSKSDGYQPPAYWSYCADIKKQLDIPVIANGEIWTLDDFKLCQEQSQCDDFMLGRGLLASPFLAQQIRTYSQGGIATSNNWQDIAPLLISFFIETCKIYPERYTGNRVKQWLHYLQRHYAEAASLFEQIKKSRDFDFIHQQISDSF